jgi:hypothetical protein
VGSIPTLGTISFKIKDMKVKMVKRAGKYMTGETYSDIPKEYEKYLLENEYAVKAITKKPKNKAIEKAPKNKQEFIGSKNFE